MSTLRRIFTASLIILVTLCATRSSMAANDKANPNAGQWTGNYDAKARGYYSGEDTLKVNANDKLHLKLTLKDPAGNTVNFNVPNLNIVNGHFKGSGKINGLDVTVEGRFDAPAAGESYKFRFSADYHDANKHSGRIVAIKQN
jgi:hypothetical protein